MSGRVCVDASIKDKVMLLFYPKSLTEGVGDSTLFFKQRQKSVKLLSEKDLTTHRPSA
ncbi:MAG: hypothetical protein QXE06_06395 [Candidatus Bathyarchaeia archaeon]